MTDAPHTSSDAVLRVLVAGGGIAALEAAFALHELAGVTPSSVGAGR